MSIPSRSSIQSTGAIEPAGSALQALASMRAAAHTAARLGRNEQLRSIDRVKLVLLTAELTAHFNGAAFRKNLFSLLCAQTGNHFGYACTAAITLEAWRSAPGLSNKVFQWLLPEQVSQQGINVQRQ